jgi:hypothetical protein
LSKACILKLRNKQQVSRLSYIYVGLKVEAEKCSADLNVVKGFKMDENLSSGSQVDEANSHCSQFGEPA